MGCGVSAIPSAEVVMERLRMALAEAGYPDAYLRHIGTDEWGWHDVSCYVSVSDPHWWMACRIVYGPTRHAPWGCRIAEGRTSKDCVLGLCSHLGPALPPRELLRAS